MRNTARILSLTLCVMLYAFGFRLQGQDVMTYTRYTTSDGLSHRTVSSIVQDRDGLIWMATWNGICCFDGQQFTTYNETTDKRKLGRLIYAEPLDDGNIWCLSHNNDSSYIFNPQNLSLHTSPNHPITRPSSKPYQLKLDTTGLVISKGSDTYTIPFSHQRGLTVDSRILGISDRDGSLWAYFDDALWHIVFTPRPFHHHSHISTSNGALFNDEVRALTYHNHLYWLAEKSGHIHLYDSAQTYAGSLSADGTIMPHDSAHFGAKVYAFLSDSLGSLWLGSKGDGLWRHTASCPPQLRQQTFGHPNRTSLIYDLQNIGQHLWIATWGEGAILIPHHGYADTIVRHLAPQAHIRQITTFGPYTALLTTQGIRLYDDQLRECQTFGQDYDVAALHTTPDGLTFVSTMGKGLYTLDTTGGFQLIPYTLTTRTGSDDIILSIITDTAHNTWFIGENTLFCRTTHSQWLTFDAEDFGSPVIFGEARPLCRNNELWLGTLNGYLIVRTNMAIQSALSSDDKICCTISGSIWIGILSLSTIVLLIVGIVFYFRRNKQKKQGMIADTDKTPSEDDRLFFEKASAFVTQNISNPNLTVEDLAAHLNISRTVLYMTVKKHLHTTPAVFITECRIKKACEILEHENPSLTDLAFRIGFANAAYFGRVFKRKTGLSPKHYAEKIREEKELHSASHSISATSVNKSTP